MFASLLRFFARRRFRSIAQVLPVRLFEKYGGGGVYTSDQVRRAARDLKLKGATARMAFAVACSSAEFLKAQPSCTLDDYNRLRGRFRQLFGIDRDDFNIQDIRRLNRVPRQDWIKAGPGGADTGIFHDW